MVKDPTHGSDAGDSAIKLPFYLYALTMTLSSSAGWMVCICETSRFIIFQFFGHSKLHLSISTGYIYSRIKGP